MFPRWANDDSKIARFMQNLDPTKKYDEREFILLCDEHGVRLSDIVIKKSSSKSRKYGNIIASIDNTYQLYPTLVTAYNKYF